MQCGVRMVNFQWCRYRAMSCTDDYYDGLGSTAPTDLALLDLALLGRDDEWKLYADWMAGLFILFCASDDRI